MGPDSYPMMALGVLNLLLVASGFLLVYFDWSAARRREFLYLYFTEEKPGINYFAAARRRRAQYTRLLIAFSILFAHEFLTATNAPLSDPASLDFQVWLWCVEIFGLVLLANGFLFKPQQDKAPVADLVAGGFLALWFVFTIWGVSDAPGRNAIVVRDVVVAARFAIVAAVAYAALRQRGQPVERGLLSFDPVLLTTAFTAWFVGSLLSYAVDRAVPIEGNMAAIYSLLGQAIAYALIVPMILRGVLAEYEAVETSRHRLGRERQVIVSFLSRIGAAFTTEVEVEQVLHIILESALDTTEASAGAIYLYKAETGLLEPGVVLHFFPPLYVDTPAALSPHRTEELEEEMKHQSFHLGEGIIGTVAQSGQSQIVDDVHAAGIMKGTTTDYMRNRSMLVVPLRIRDEPLGVMAVLNKQRGSFVREDQSLLQALADQGALFVNNAMLTIEVGQQERLRRELQIARDIQQRLLPRECPVIPGFEIAALGTSATEVGGDYYDFFWVDDDHLGIVVADVSGKGVHAALVVAMIRSAFRSQARGNPDVCEVMSSVNEYISEDLRRDMFITCVYGILEVSTKKFSWARAGHEPIIVAHPSDSVDVLSPDGFALGVIGSPDFGEALELNTVQLKPGDRLLMFTDGLTEAMNANGEEFGMQRILQVMAHANGAPSPNGNTKNGATSNPPAPSEADQSAALANNSSSLNREDRSPCAPEPSENEPEDLKSIERAVQSHVGNAPQSDDLTIVYVGAT